MQDIYLEDRVSEDDLKGQRSLDTNTSRLNQTTHQSSSCYYILFLKASLCVR